MWCNSSVVIIEDYIFLQQQNFKTLLTIYPRQWQFQIQFPPNAFFLRKKINKFAAKAIADKNVDYIEISVKVTYLGYLEWRETVDLHQYNWHWYNLNLVRSGQLLKLHDHGHLQKGLHPNLCLFINILIFKKKYMEKKFCIIPLTIFKKPNDQVFVHRKEISASM